MKRIFAPISLAATVFAASAAPLFAGFGRPPFWGGWGGWGRPPVSVPEIDASTGLLAVAAVLATVAFVAERRRRAN